MTVFDRIYNAALLPQIKTGSADDAVLAAKALLSGGVDAMELICRSDDEAAAIAAVQEQCPDMLVGAQCATWEACEKAAESGAQFLTTPGYSEKIVAWCDERGIPVIPGCVTPSEIMAATVQGARHRPRLYARPCRRERGKCGGIARAVQDVPRGFWL